MSAPVVILGAGLAGFGVARELRKLDKQVAIRVVTADAGAFYSKPNLSNALAWQKTPAQLVAAPRAAIAAQLGVDIVDHVRAVELLPAEHALRTGDGRIDYGRLVLAIGAQPIRLPIEGSGAADILSVNHLDDYAVFRRQLAGKRRIAILGAGLIGCEFANDLAGAGFAVEVFDLAPQPLSRLLPAAAAAFFARGLAAAGVRFHFATSVGRVDRHGDAYVLRDLEGRRFEADLVLSAVGLRPETALAKAAGLTINRGIVVDRQLATSDAAIHAVGDCAEVQGLVLPFVLPIMQQARALAKTLAGMATPVDYPAMPVVVKTPACPTVVCPPPAGLDGAWREEASADGVRALFVDAAGKPLGFALVGAATSAKQALAPQMPAWL
ncbi:MAG: FAD-dependent oxidoreductase [Rhodocyclaceae bacterium]|nr:FAD-dependent oxidoreductase [Rhodocyclaceae bacterium]